MFVSIYGSEAGNVALQYRATGGVYLAGGIAGKILPALKERVFRESFRSKSPLESLLARVPVRVVRERELGVDRRGRGRLPDRDRNDPVMVEDDHPVGGAVGPPEAEVGAVDDRLDVVGVAEKAPDFGLRHALADGIRPACPLRSSGPGWPHRRPVSVRIPGPAARDPRSGRVRSSTMPERVGLFSWIHHPSAARTASRKIRRTVRPVELKADRPRPAAGSLAAAAPRAFPGTRAAARD